MSGSTVLNSFSDAKAESGNRQSAMNRIMELMWTNGPVMDSFRRNGRGWQAAVANNLGVSRDDLTRFITATGGVRRLRDIVFGNPAGLAPSVVDMSKMPVHMAESYGCPTSGCATSGCATAHCGTYTCGTYACGDRSPSPDNGKPTVA